MRIRLSAFLCCLAAALAAPPPAAAQYGARPVADTAPGEDYRVEVGFAFWNPTPDIVISSESLGIIGSHIDFVNDLAIEKSRFTQLRVVLKPARKHKFRFEFTPISYEAQATLHRDVIFNGQRFSVNLPVATELEWKAYRFGYEWDFVSRDRGFVGLLLEAKYTDVRATLSNVLVTEFTHARAPIPAIGIIGRGYVARNVAITGEFSGFKLPESINEDYGAKYYDFDLYGTVNFNRYVGAQLGYRSFDVFYKLEDDDGTLKLNGIYFGGVARF
ncbi:MAG TPA: hypothetical protein VFK20_09100 [Vicinamibacterales bacterium]|nr:hypothetical protein [Vicinamibacterales bacterium]